MKKLAAMIVSIMLVMCFVGCGDKKEQSGSTEATTVQQSPTDVSEGPAAQQTPTDGEATEESTEESTIYSDSSVLVVYFSQTGTTKKLAEYAAEYYQADVFEITAKNPYTDEDIDTDKRDNRAAKEQEDETARPEINGTVENIEQYDMIILAYPIWYDKAPRIIDTFVESYDFAGQTIVPFCTSSSSDIDASVEELQNLTDDSVTWMDGTRFDSTTTKEDVVSWFEMVCPME